MNALNPLRRRGAGAGIRLTCTLIFGIEFRRGIQHQFSMSHLLDTISVEEKEACSAVGERSVGASVCAVDLFCGAGGLTHGLQRAGITVVEGVDIDGACKFAYEANNGCRFVHKSALDYTEEDIASALEGAGVRVLVGCAPCQPFSTYTQGPRGKHQDKWAMLERFGQLALATRPDIVSMENVAPLAGTDQFSSFVEELDSAGFRVKHWIVDCREYGAPQQRRRLVLLASRHGEIDILPPTHTLPERWTAVRDAIGEMPPLAAGDADAKDPLHRTSQLSPTNMRRMHASKPGGTWRDWPEELRAPCHVRESGRTYLAVYGRMEWDKPAPTMTGQCFGFGNGRFGHPEQHRAISLREAAILQTFPSTYEFIEPGTPIHMKSVGRMIGNAVPPLLAEVIGNSILRHINDVNIVGTD